MARNAEKAMTALARWRRMKQEEERGPVLRRPNRTTDCTNVKHADRWRREVVMDIAKKIQMIQNPGLGEFKIRDMNDEINKLLRTKYQWEMRIKELGGQDHGKIAPRLLDREGREVPGNRGYKYFGAAKDLPGVRDLFETATPDEKKKNRGELMRLIDADYYGYMDDDDGILEPLEQIEQKQARQCAGKLWKEGKVKELQARQPVDQEDIYAVDDEENEEVNVAAGEQAANQIMQLDECGQPKFITQITVPSQEQIEEALVHRKKMQLLEKYASDSLVQQSNEARALLGFDKQTPDT